MFHEYRDLITELKQKDGHFHKLFEEHNALDDAIAKLENSHASQFDIEAKKKEKLKLKDEIYSILVNHKKEN
jgi:uncharacterized protein